MEAAVTHKHRQLAALHLALIICAGYLLSRAWVTEDAFITLRTVDNAVHGYGLVWNIGERVQSYTHPLWMLLHIPIHALWPNLFHVSIALCFVSAMASLALPVLTSRKSLSVSILCFLIPFLASKSLVDFSGSGLENALSHLLFALFAQAVFYQSKHRYFWCYCTLLFALAIITRLDVILLYAPVMLIVLLLEFRTHPSAIRHIALGLLPAIAWYGFSLFYYGFVFPNTKYAKLDTGISSSLLVRNGLDYLQSLWVFDAAGAVYLISIALWCIMQKRRKRNTTLTVAFTLGIACYMLYVVRIGGDYMAGRFWSLPIYAALWLLYTNMPARLSIRQLSIIIPLLALTLLTAITFRAWHAGCNNCLPVPSYIEDNYAQMARNHLFAITPSFRLRHDVEHPFSNTGRNYAKHPPGHVIEHNNVGMIGFYAGPQTHIVDGFCIADPLRARFPATYRDNFLIGHHFRTIPKGYIHALNTGDLSDMDPVLAHYYEKLRLIIAGDLWDGERLKTILLFNLGYYDHWKHEYLLCNQ